MTERFRKDTLMSMMNTGDILETIEMFTQDNLDVRTVTMGISLLDCIDPDPKKACENIYNKITTKAANLVSTVEHISAEYGIPIINKRISVTPIAMLLGACPDADPVDFAKALDAAGKPYIKLVASNGLDERKIANWSSMSTLILIPTAWAKISSPPLLTLCSAACINWWRSSCRMAPISPR